MSIRANESAFPRPAVYVGDAQAWPGADGVTMREWYAGQALAGLLAHPGFADSTAVAAALAFKAADAMLVEAAKGSPP